jgi:hypothetical protein
MMPASAATIVATFDSSFASAADPASAMTAANAAVAAINALYSNPGNIPVLLKYDAGLGGGASTNTAILSLPYATYKAALLADLTAHPENAILSTALASLPASLTQTITVTAAYYNLVPGGPLFSCFDAAGNFHGACGQAYAAVVTLSGSGAGYYASTPGNNSLATSVAEHELNEVLDGGGSGTTLDSSYAGGPIGSYGPLDLYRYVSTGSGADACTSAADGLTTTWSYTTSSSAVACYSIDGGHNGLPDAAGHGIRFNQAGGGSDYADWYQPLVSDPAIQDAFVPSTAPPLYTSSSPEFAMMESIGYNAVPSVPEPGTLSMLVLGVAGLGLARRRIA